MPITLLVVTLFEKVVKSTQTAPDLLVEAHAHLHERFDTIQCYYEQMNECTNDSTVLLNHGGTHFVDGQKFPGKQ